MGRLSRLAKIALAGFLLFAPVKKVLGQENQDVKNKSVLVINPGHVEMNRVMMGDRLRNRL